MRIVYWNIRAGGGKRVPGIAEQLEAWHPDVIALSEFRGTPPGQELAKRLFALGLVHQRSAVCRTTPAVNSVFIASRSALRAIRLQRQPVERRRWLLVKLEQGPWLGAMHAPNYVTGRKRQFLDSVYALATTWRGGPAIIGGDTNTGVPPQDGNPDMFRTWEAQWIPRLAAQGWKDAYRLKHPHATAHTWYSPNAGNGYRLDQAFVNRAAAAMVYRVKHLWGRAASYSARRDALSDHAALLVDLGAARGASVADS